MSQQPSNETATQPYRVLVAVGPDNVSGPAISEAIRIIGSHPNAELHTVTVVEERLPATSAMGMNLLDRQLDEAPKQLETSLQSAAGELGFGGTAIGHIRIGKPAEAIIQAAVDVQADVIVVGTHQRRGIDRFFLGSVAEQVVRDSHCPVMVVTDRNYEGLHRSRRPDPACPDCLKTRADTAGAKYWCEQHSRKYVRTETYSPTERSFAARPTGVRIV